MSPAGAQRPRSPLALCYLMRRCLHFTDTRKLSPVAVNVTFGHLSISMKVGNCSSISFNSIPLMLMLIAAGYFLGSRSSVLVLTGASALLHLCCDFPFHHDDAHRHFLPLTNWRFASPVSYWDPRHFGRTFMILEIAFTTSACGTTILKSKEFPMRFLAGLTLAAYLAGIVFAIVMWML